MVNSLCQSQASANITYDLLIEIFGMSKAHPREFLKERDPFCKAGPTVSQIS